MGRRGGSARLVLAIGSAVLAGALCVPGNLSATSMPEMVAGDMPAIRYMPAIGETQITARLDPALCVAFSLPQEWRQDNPDGTGIRLVASTGEGEIELAWRAVRDLTELPRGEAVVRDAALLQRDHEAVLGRKAQASSVETVGRATRWTATWIDTSLPAPSHTLTVETYIVPASHEWLLELSVSDIGDRRAYDNLVRQVLSNIRTASTAQCGRMS
jgi:hypothetical protein